VPVYVVTLELPAKATSVKRLLKSNKAQSRHKSPLRSGVILFVFSPPLLYDIPNGRKVFRQLTEKYSANSPKNFSPISRICLFLFFNRV